MKVSVITAVRNGAGSIARTVESVNRQKYADIEHIFVDGASTDGTVELIRELSQRERRLVSEKDSGVYEAFAKGSKLATGDIVAYLNAGDVYSDEDVISTVVGTFVNSNIDAVFGDVDIVDEANLERVVRRYRSSRFRPSMVPYGFMPAHPSLFIRRSVYEVLGSYNPTYRIAGDFELVVRFFVGGAISYICLDRSIARMPRGGLSTSGPRSNWTITTEMRRACAENGIATNYFKLALRFPIKATEWFWLG